MVGGALSVRASVVAMQTPSTAKVIVNLFAYQVAWFACVLGAANDMPWLGTMVCLAIVAVHLLSEQSLAAIKLVLACAILGLALDSVLAASGVARFASGTFTQGLAPHWMVALWMAFATTLNVSLQWLMRRPSWAMAVGLVGGPLAYLAGARLGAMQIEPLLLGLAAIGALWALAMWVLALLATRWSPVPIAERLT